MISLVRLSVSYATKRSCYKGPNLIWRRFFFVFNPSRKWSTHHDPEHWTAYKVLKITTSSVISLLTCRPGHSEASVRRVHVWLKQQQELVTRWSVPPAAVGRAGQFGQPRRSRAISIPNLKILVYLFSQTEFNFTAPITLSVAAIVEVASWWIVPSCQPCWPVI